MDFHVARAGGDLKGSEIQNALARTLDIPRARFNQQAFARKVAKQNIARANFNFHPAFHSRIATERDIPRTGF